MKAKNEFHVWPGVFAVSLVVLGLGAGCKREDTRTAESTYAPSGASTNKVYQKEMVDRSPSDRLREPAVPPDNSRVNVRDRADSALTPGDQGSSDTDRAMTQQIRKSLTSGPNDYSVAAQNVKIITENGKVTLRGVVKTAAEKQGIADIAKSVAGAENLDDQLEVKTNP